MLIFTTGIIIWGGSPAFADYTYLYTGPDYSTSQCTGSYVASCTSDHVTGSFTTGLSLSQLEDLRSGEPIDLDTVSSFSFSDGSGLTLSQQNAVIDDLVLDTGSSGQISFWDILVETDDGADDILTANCIDCTHPDFVQVSDSSATPTGFGSTVSFPGGQTWTGPLDASAPEASAGLLTVIGLLMLAGLRAKQSRHN